MGFNSGFKGLKYHDDQIKEVEMDRADNVYSAVVKCMKWKED